jgi:hypothetical protein
MRPRFGVALWCAGRSAGLRRVAAVMTRLICLGLLAAGCAHHPITTGNVSVNVPVVLTPPHPWRADFKLEQKSPDARCIADWVVDSADNHGMPFVIVDKVDARIFVFDADGRLRGGAPVLVGLARGDDSVPGIGDRELAKVRPEERTTPAGRFAASLGYEYNGKEVVWVDYGLALSLHRVVTTKPSERRLERLASPKPRDHRISFGCINVPAHFFDDVVIPVFTGTYVIVYILPDTRSNSEIFASYYDVDARWGTAASAASEETGGTRGGSQPDSRPGKGPLGNVRASKK